MNYRQCVGIFMLVAVLLNCVSCSINTAFELGKSPQSPVIKGKGKGNISNPAVDNVRKPEWL